MERRSYSSRTVFSVLSVSLALAFVLALFIHNQFGRYQPRVAYHLPERVRSAVWLNVEHNVGFDVFKRHLLPLLEEGREQPEPLVKHLERKTTLELEVDTRECAVAVTEEGNWIVLLGGLFRRDEVGDGLLRLFQDEGQNAHREGDLVVSERGFAVGIADDSVLILSNDVRLARDALITDAGGAAWKALLQKPGTTLNSLAYEHDVRFAGVRPLGVGAQRAWLSIEPGNPFRVFFEQVGGGGDEITRQIPFSADGFKALQSPDGMRSWSGTASSEAFDAAVGRWARELSALTVQDRQSP